MVLTEFVVLLAFGSRFYFDKKLNDLSEVLDQKQAQISAFEETEIEIRKILAKQTVVNAYMKDNLGLSTKYNELASIMPSGVKLDKLTVDGVGMNMSGEAQSELGFAQLLRGLKQLPSVTRISIKDTNFDQITGSVKFSVLTTFK